RDPIGTAAGVADAGRSRRRATQRPRQLNRVAPDLSKLVNSASLVNRVNVVPPTKLTSLTNRTNRANHTMYNPAYGPENERFLAEKRICRPPRLRRRRRLGTTDAAQTGGLWFAAGEADVQSPGRPGHQRHRGPR